MFSHLAAALITHNHDHRDDRGHYPVHVDGPTLVRRQEQVRYREGEPGQEEDGGLGRETGPKGGRNQRHDEKTGQPHEQGQDYVGVQ